MAIAFIPAAAPRAAEDMAQGAFISKSELGSMYLDLGFLVQNESSLDRAATWDLGIIYNLADLLFVGTGCCISGYGLYADFGSMYDMPYLPLQLSLADRMTSIPGFLKSWDNCLKIEACYYFSRTLGMKLGLVHPVFNQTGIIKDGFSEIKRALILDGVWN